MFTKWIEAFPLKKATAQNVAKILIKQIFCRYGFCEQIHTDRGTQFTSELFQELLQLCNIKLTHTPAYNPKSNSVERMHRDLKSALMALTQEKPSQWPEFIPAILYAFRTSISSSTGFSPYQLMFGRRPIEDLDLIMPSPTHKKNLMTASAYCKELIGQVTDAHHIARENMKVAIERQKNNYRRTPKEFKAGQRVWLFTPVIGERKLPKFVTGWTGPWVITRVINPVTYEIKFKKDGISKKDVVSIDRLRLYLTDDPEEPHLHPTANHSSLPGDGNITLIPPVQSPQSYFPSLIPQTFMSTASSSSLPNENDKSVTNQTSSHSTSFDDTLQYVPERFYAGESDHTIIDITSAHDLQQAKANTYTNQSTLPWNSYGMIADWTYDPLETDTSVYHDADETVVSQQVTLSSSPPTYSKFVPVTISTPSKVPKIKDLKLSKRKDNVSKPGKGMLSNLPDEKVGEPSKPGKGSVSNLPELSYPEHIDVGVNPGEVSTSRTPELSQYQMVLEKAKTSQKTIVERAERIKNRNARKESINKPSPDENTETIVDTPENVPENDDDQR